MFASIFVSILLATECSAFTLPVDVATTCTGNLRRKDGKAHYVQRMTPRAMKLGVVPDDEVPETDRSSRGDTQLVFPGGGIFFYWQAGAVTYLREQGYDLSGSSFSGASAGALAATLTATGVDFERATKLALDLAEEAGVWDRSGGLQGIWGAMIQEWLEELLPDDAVDLVDGRLSLLVTPVPSFGKSTIRDFHDRQDLIQCNMASVHLPWFLDNRLTANFRGAPHIDGSFLARATDYHQQEQQNSIFLDWTKDPIMAKKAFEFVKVVSKESIWNIKETGMRFAERMEADGHFEMLRCSRGETYA